MFVVASGKDAEGPNAMTGGIRKVQDSVGHGHPVWTAFVTRFVFTPQTEELAIRLVER